MLAGIIDEDILLAEAAAGLDEEYFAARHRSHQQFTKAGQSVKALKHKGVNALPLQFLLMFYRLNPFHILDSVNALSKLHF